eukprot:5251604-Pleurochrysis_carterae.AAC.1
MCGRIEDCVVVARWTGAPACGGAAEDGRRAVGEARKPRLAQQQRRVVGELRRTRTRTAFLAGKQGARATGLWEAEGRWLARKRLGDESGGEMGSAV